MDAKNIIAKELRASEYRRIEEAASMLKVASNGTICLDSLPGRAAVLDEDYELNAMPPGAVRQTLGVGPISAEIHERTDLLLASRNLGMDMGNTKLRMILTNLIAAGVASARNISGHLCDMAAIYPSPLTHVSFAGINRMLKTMDDAREDILAFIMPSVIFSDLVGDSIANYQFDRIAGMTVYQDVVQAFGRAVIVADVPALVQVPAEGGMGYWQYHILGLGKGMLSATIVQQDGVEVQQDIVDGARMQYVREDYVVEYSVLGAEWKSEKEDPCEGTLANALNWQVNFGDHREVKLIAGRFNASANV